MKRLALASLVLLCCTDPGVVGELANPAVPASQPSAAGSSGSASGCLLGVCELPPLCASDEPFCLLCDEDRDCHDPDEPFCGAFSFCVQCRTSNDCSAGAPICDGGECVVCEDDDDCPGSLQCDDGQCLPD